MATWNLESVGTKGYGGGGSYFCARAAKAILKRKEERDEENYDGIGVFKDPLLDSVYGQCSSTTRPLRHTTQDDAGDVADLLKPTGIPAEQPVSTDCDRLRACPEMFPASRGMALALLSSLPTYTLQFPLLDEYI